MAETKILQLTSSDTDQMRLQEIRCNETGWSSAGLPMHEILFLENHELVVRKDGRVISVYRRDRA